jgi:2-polyprenyl-3-methyl-5-hydroxy-6-metoxy-1,4-benzoquinol methylase
VSSLSNNSIAKRNILSFGCSYGQECFSLRKYFDIATITGYDINRANIDKAKFNNTDFNIIFHSKWKKVYKKEYYDIVFAMSVLCQWPGTKDIENCSKIYSFNIFEDKVTLLDTMIKPGGILVIYNANFRFTDTLISKKYTAIHIPEYFESGFVSKFSVSNQYLADQKYEYSVFIKKLQ